MKCPNCGAVMHNGKCEYCGSDTNVSAVLEETTGILKYKGKEFKVYLESVEVEQDTDICRNFDGTLHRVLTGSNYTFVLRSYQRW